MGVEELLKSKREEILRIAAKHGARNVRVFGSIARGEDDGEAFEEKMQRLAATLRGQFEEAAKLEKAIKANLKSLGFDI